MPRIAIMTSIPHGTTILSISYERRSVEDLIRLLTRNQVDVLVIRLTGTPLTI